MHNDKIDINGETWLREGHMLEAEWGQEIMKRVPHAELWLNELCTLHEALSWARGGYPHPDDSRLWRERNFTVEVRKLWGESFTPDEASAWLERGLGFDEATEWKKRGVSIDVAARWFACDDLEVGAGTRDEACAWINAGVEDPELAVLFMGLDVTPPDAAPWASVGLEPRVLRSWIEADRSPEDVAKWTAVGVMHGECATAWDEEGCSPVDAEPWVKDGYDTDCALEWVRCGFTLEEANVCYEHGVEDPSQAEELRSVFTKMGPPIAEKPDA